MIGISFIYPQSLWLLLLIPLTVILGLIGRRAYSRARLWGGLALRAFLLLLIVLALAGIQLRLPSSMLTAVFVLDASDSIPPEETARGEAWIRAAVQEMPSSDRAAIVVFGEDALVERLASPDSSLARLSSNPITTRTDIGSAMQLAMALFPDEGARRLVLLSDGRENLGYAVKQAELAALQDIELTYVPLGVDTAEAEVLIEALNAPTDAREGQEFDLTVVVQSTVETAAVLRVTADDALIHTQELTLRPGSNRYVIPVRDAGPGFHRYRAQIVPDIDNRLQNNEASAFTVVSGPPSILIVEGRAGEGGNLTSALETAGMKVRRMAPGELPATLPELAQYDAIILANVSAAALPTGAMEALPVYVRDLGRGLLMTGGDRAFGAGGYLRTPLEAALPVFMDVKSRELAANLALVVAVDKSGSMGRCHCDDPDLNQSYTPSETGQPKVDIAKEAIMRSAAALGPDDYLGVVTFDAMAHWTLETQKLVDPLTLEAAIGRFQAEGQTNMASGVTAAYNALQNVDARRKHIILMTDGWVRTGELTSLVEEMKDHGITLSVVAAGEGSAEYLEALAQAGGGRYYPAVDMMSVPDVFLKETVTSVGEYIIEEPFYPLPANPSPALRNIDTANLPALFGYNGTSPKSTARLDLITPRGDPLLASWQHGLGRAAAWTSDMKGQWATNFVSWSEYARFSAQLVSWLLPAPKVDGLTPQVTLQDNGALVTLTALDEDGRPLNFLNVTARLIGPDLNPIELPMAQTGSGRYEALARVADPGTYLVWIGASDSRVSLGQLTMGLVVPYSPEYRAGGANLGLLEELARLTGGGPLAEPVNAFLHNLPSADSAREVWRTLLLLAALLFPLDVALRRVLLSPRDLQKARAWLRSRLPGAAAPRDRGEPVLGQLFSARERARDRHRREQASETARKQPPVPDQTSSPRPPEAPQAPAGDASAGAAPPEDSGDALARLREAKRRARRQ